MARICLDWQKFSTGKGDEHIRASAGKLNAVVSGCVWSVIWDEADNLDWDVVDQGIATSHEAAKRAAEAVFGLE